MFLSQLSYFFTSVDSNKILTNSNGCCCCGYGRGFRIGKCAVPRYGEFVVGLDSRAMEELLPRSIQCTKLGTAKNVKKRVYFCERNPLCNVNHEIILVILKVNTERKKANFIFES